MRVEDFSSKTPLIHLSFSQLLGQPLGRAAQCCFHLHHGSTHGTSALCISSAVGMGIGLPPQNGDTSPPPQVEG